MKTVWVLTFVNHKLKRHTDYVYTTEKKAKRMYAMMFTEYPSGGGGLKELKVY